MFIFYGNLAERKIEAEEEVVTFRRQWKDDCKSLERRPEYVSDIFDCFTFSENTKLRFILSWFEIYLYIWHKQAKKDIYLVQLCQIKMARGARKIVSSTASLGIGKIKLRSYQGKALHQFTLLIVWSNHYNLFSSRQQHKFAYCSGTFRCYGRV